MSTWKRLVYFKNLKHTSMLTLSLVGQTYVCFVRTDSNLLESLLQTKPMNTSAFDHSWWQVCPISGLTRPDPLRGILLARPEDRVAYDRSSCLRLFILYPNFYCLNNIRIALFSKYRKITLLVILVLYRYYINYNIFFFNLAFLYTLNNGYEIKYMQLSEKEGVS